jgi:hypothetical protein
VRGVIWDFVGPRLEPWQATQRLYNAGFKDAKTLATIWAVMEAESARYLRAFHHNVVRDGDGEIVRDSEGRFHVKSTDLGFIQRNVVHLPVVRLLDEESRPFVERLFEKYPDLARGDRSAELAFHLYQDRGYDPWVAYRNGSYKKHAGSASVAVGNFLSNYFGLGKTYVKRA